jgi:hypothetical protein
MEGTDMKFTMELSAVAVLGIVMATGCASNDYRSVEAGVVAVGKMRVTLGPGWRRAPDAETPEKLALSRVYSRDGLEHDRLILVANINEGQAIFREEPARGLPKFRTAMGIPEIADLVAASLQAVLWDGTADVRASNIREHGFLGVPGLMFDLEADVPGAKNHRGMAGGYVDEERLYINIFLAESPGYYERHKQVAQEVIESAVPTIKTIRMSAVEPVGLQERR